jgi:two-component system, cell cycle sensor histidine kinase and response regulator CckA
VRLELQRQQSQKMESLGQLAGGIAHDFNNLLTAIIGYSNLILGGYDSSPEAVRVDVEEIRRAAESASSLTRQILAFSRRQPLRPEIVSLNDVVGELTDLLRRTLGERIELVTALDPGLGLAEVDPTQLIHVVVNLTLNAHDAMPNGGCLTIETSDVDLDEAYCARHPDAVPGPHVLLAASDTGVGMDAQTVSRIFEPFFTTKAHGQGTGLGLSTVHGIVAQSGGSIAVSSELGRGTRFEIYLPRIAEGAVDRSSSRAQLSVPATPLGEETILVVEDESAVRHLVERILTREGYTVLVAGDAGEAEILLRESRPIHLLLTDVVLPGRMQGNDVAALAVASHPHLPVLYMSGYPRDAIVNAGRLHIGVNYLDKPFSPSVLVERIRELLDQEAASGRSGR